MRHMRQFNRRSGNIMVLTAFMLVMTFAMVAFAIDVGYISVVRSQAQRAADASALAAAWDLLDENIAARDYDPSEAILAADDTAQQYGRLNQVGGEPALLAGGDVEVGYLDESDAQMSFDDPSRFNAVSVRVRRTTDQGGAVPLFFAKVLGTDRADVEATGTAHFMTFNRNNFGGFRYSSVSGENLMILPFALDKPTWDALLAGSGDDDWCWDAELQEVVSGSDGILEVNLYPKKTKDAPGNRGTVDIGNTNNATPDIRRQILYGISEADLAHHGGELRFDENHELLLNGDTGLSAAVQHELKEIIGQKRAIPIFTKLEGPGNNAYYTIVDFVGVRILDVDLNGSPSKKHVTIQPAPMIANGAIVEISQFPDPNPGETYLYSPVHLVR